MSGKIAINYEAVYAKRAELSADMRNCLAQMDGEYTRMRTALSGMDSKTNAALDSAMLVNKQKAEAMCEVLENLLAFIEASAMQIQQEEMILKGTFSMGAE